MNGEKLAFLRSIEKDPRDYALRGVYADWLDENGEPEEAERQRNWEKIVAESEKWLRSYAIKLNPYMFDDNDEYRYDEESIERLIGSSNPRAEAAFRKLLSNLRDGELYAYGSDLHGRYDLDDAEDLKYHAEIYLNIPIDWEQFSFYCSC